MSEFNNKIVLITGATGLIGSNLVKYFMSMMDVKVIAAGRNEKKLKKVFYNYKDDDKLSICSFDVSETFPEFSEGVDYIFHAAGPMEGRIIQNTPMDVIRPNINGIINCFEFLRRMESACEKRGRLVVFSSVTVYFNNSEVDKTVTEQETRITDSLDSISACYSQSKRLSEVIAGAYIRQYGCDAVIARLSTVYGDTVYHPDTAFFQFIHKALDGQNIQMNVSGIGRRDNIYIDDAVRGLVAIARNGKCGEVYNVSSNGELGNYAAVDEVAQAILDTVDEKRAISEKKRFRVEYRDGGNNCRKPGLKLDNSKLKELGWNIENSMNIGIKKTIESIEFKKQNR